MKRKEAEPPGPPLVRLDLDSAVPISAQLYRQIVTAVARGALAEGTILPSARQLAVELGVHYHTVNKAYGLLRRDGFASIDRRKQVRVHRPDGPGSGFVVDWTARQQLLLDEALGSGLTSGEVLRRLREMLDPPPERRPAIARHAR